MRRKDREMSKEFAYMVADQCEYAVISMTLEDGTPYGIPISIVRIEEFVYFHCAKEGMKVNALKHNPRVCIACVGDTHRMEYEFTTEFESAVIFGLAEEVMETEEKIMALQALCERHTPANMGAFEDAIERSLNRTAVWRVRITEITGKRKKYDSHGKEMKFGRME